MKQTSVNLSLTLIFLFLPKLSHAQMIAWTDDIPSALKPFQNNAQALANIAQDNIVVYGHAAQKTFIPTLKTNPNPVVHFNSAAIVVPVSTQEVAKTLADYSHYVGLFPTLKSAKIQAQTGSISQVKYKVSIPTPIPVLNFNEDVTIQHQLGQNSLSSLVIDSPIPYAVGKFEWFSLSEKKTLITLTQWGDLDQPQGFLISRILKAIPEAKLGIPSGSNAFVLESLKRRFVPNKLINLAPGQFPSTNLNNAQLQQVVNITKTSGQPFSLILTQTTVPYTHGREAMRFSTTYQYYPVAAAQLQKWLKPNAYQSLFPRQIKKTTLGPLSNAGQDSTFKVSVGLGVISIPFDFNMHFNYPNPNENNFAANGGDLRYVKGQTSLQSMSSGTLMKMTTAMKIDETAPFLLRAMRSLPYHDMLPAIGANTVFMQKIRMLK